MPFPLALAAVPATVSAIISGASYVGALALYVAPWLRADELPAPTKAVEAVVQAVHADIEALVVETAERASQDEQKTIQGNERLSGAVTRLGPALTAMDEGVRASDEAIAAVVASNEPNTEALQRLTEEQVNINSGLKLQQSDMKAIAEKLNDLPSLLRTNQEKRALEFKNKQLEDKVGALEKKFSEGLLHIEELEAFSDEQQREIDELQKELQATHSGENAENSNSNPNVRFFGGSL